jgi:hypothetical protein
VQFHLADLEHTGLGALSGKELPRTLVLVVLHGHLVVQVIWVLEIFGLLGTWFIKLHIITGLGSAPLGRPYSSNTGKRSRWR